LEGVSNSWITFFVETYIEFCISIFLGLEFIKQFPEEMRNESDKYGVLATYIFAGWLIFFTLLVMFITCCLVRPKVRYERERLQHKIGTVVLQNIKNRPWFEEIVDYGPHKFFQSARNVIPSNPKRKGKKLYFKDVSDLADELKTGRLHRIVQQKKKKRVKRSVLD